MKEAVQKTGDVHLKIESDSKYALDAVTKNRKNRKKWEDQGYIGVSNKKVNKATVAALRQREGETKLRWVKGHNGHHRNEGADRKADEGAKKPERDDVPLEIPQDQTVTGAKLSAMSQLLAYRAIRECKRKKNKERDRTQANLERAKAECEDNFGFIPMEDKIWKSQLNKDFSREQQYFLWMATHDAYWVGTHWLRESTTAEMKEREECQHCGTIESMEHILSQCEILGQKEVWDLVKELWTKRNPNWPWPGIGTIISASLANFKNEEGKMKPGEARLYRILMAESAHLSWTHPAETEVHKKWVLAMNHRLKLDCDMTDDRRFEKKAIPVKTVLCTWTGVLEGKDKLPTDWTGVAEVLVGIRPKRQQE
ncbi:hypothetical protein DFH08DRAFT_1033933 [Mycena albidolilacea]|uniref:RNase H type-1 domain-containing protein n=1 Tax=Mycena albidolilacea TaxID=1033008 RepID=A0AAD6ZG80_9AGAR|nr:hypothetical protein DFH08DRAFT_1033933 [Mycena albidolilacea]